MAFEPPRDKTNKMACAPSEDSDQPGHPPSLNRVFAVRMKKPSVLSYPLSAQRRLWLDWAHSQFVGFVMRRLIYCVAGLHFVNGTIYAANFNLYFHRFAFLLFYWPRESFAKCPQWFWIIWICFVFCNISQLVNINHGHLSNLLWRNLNSSNIACCI